MRAFNDDALFLGHDTDDAAALALIGAGDDDYFIIFSDMKRCIGKREEMIR
jgi:hypothetical protein